MAHNKDEFITAIKQQLRRCAGFDGDEVSKAREKALDYYFQRPRGDEVAGRSHVVSGDLSAMVEANLAAMVDSFSSDRIAEFDSVGPEDEDQAQLESDTVQYFIMQKSNGVLQFVQAIKDALLLRNGIIKVYVEVKDTARTLTHHNVDPIALTEMTAASNTKLIKYDKDTGEAQIKTTGITQILKCEAVPLENFLYLADWDQLDLQEIPFCAERHIDSRSELIELFPKKKRIINMLAATSTTFNPAGNARNPKSGSTQHIGIDESQDSIEWFECYLLADQDNDGISERRRVCIAGQSLTSLLSDEPVQLVPYAAGTAIINPHRFLGISLFDKLKQVQDLNTGLQRALMDNVNSSNKSRTAILEGRVNIDDATDGRPNGTIRVNANVGDIRSAIMELPVTDTSANILQNIEYQNRIRSELGGAALDLQNAQLQVGGDGMGSQGLDRAYSVAEQLAAFFTKMLAVTLFRSTFLLAHATLREWFNEPTTIKVNGRWATSTPSDWPIRESVTIKPGMSVGERSRRANSLMQILNSQMTLSDKGMDKVLVNVEGFYRTLMDWARVSDVQNPEQYFIDPTTEESQKAVAEKQEQAQEQETLKKSLMQQAVSLEQMRLAFEKYKQDADLQFKYYDAVLDAEVEEAKITGAAIGDIIKTKRVQINGSGKQASNSDTE